jgi:hypothetical protein
MEEEDADDDADDADDEEEEEEGPGGGSAVSTTFGWNASGLRDRISAIASSRTLACVVELWQSMQLHSGPHMPPRARHSQ